MSLVVVWPDAIRSKIDTWDIADEFRIGLIETLDRRLLECLDSAGTVCMEVALPTGDCYVWLKYQRAAEHIVVTEGDIQWLD
jgi:hypothetical protein